MINAVIESLWGRMQTELLERKKWRARIELSNAIFEHLEIFHNRQRRRAALPMRTPIRLQIDPSRPTASGMKSNNPRPQYSGHIRALRQIQGDSG